MKKNYVLSYQILPCIILGYAIITILIYLYCWFMVWNNDGYTGPGGNYFMLALFSLTSFPMLLTATQSTYRELKKHETSDKWPPRWKHIVLLISSMVVGIVSFALGVYMLAYIPSL